MKEAPISRTLSVVAVEMLSLLNTHLMAGKDKAPQGEVAPSELSDDDLALMRATIYYAERRRRSQFLPEDVLGEPGWDILLDLFIAAKCNRPTATSNACLAAEVPPTTGLRWLDKLENRLLIERERDPVDSRRVNLRLTQHGHDCMKRLFLFDRPGAAER